MATAPKPQAPASAPKDATKTSIWNTLFGGGSVDGAAKDLEGRQKKLDKKIDGYKNGGMVKMTPKATPYKCGGKVK